MQPTESNASLIIECRQRIAAAEAGFARWQDTLSQTLATAEITCRIVESLGRRRLSTQEQSQRPVPPPAVRVLAEPPAAIGSRPTYISARESKGKYRYGAGQEMPELRHQSMVFSFEGSGDLPMDAPNPATLHQLNAWIDRLRAADYVVKLLKRCG